LRDSTGLLDFSPVTGFAGTILVVALPSHPGVKALKSLLSIHLLSFVHSTTSFMNAIDFRFPNAAGSYLEPVSSNNF